MTEPTPLWTPDPDRVARAQLTEFAARAAERAGRPLPDYAALHAWSVADLDGFWRCAWEFFDIVAEATSDTVLAEDRMPGAVWVPGARLNYVDQVFRDRPAHGIAVIETDETNNTQRLTWAELSRQTAAVASLLREHGVHQGDRVVGYLPNGAAAIVAFLASASLGAVWSCCGMDYAPGAALGRFGQLEPTVLFAADGYRNGGRVYDRTSAVAELRAGLPTLRAVVSVDRIGTNAIPDAVTWSEAIEHPGEHGLKPVPVAFDHPLWVLFSSGTTGIPKGIVHGHGGVVLTHLRDLVFQLDARPGEVFWWYTTPSWMMWNFQVAGLLVGATVVAYDGSPAHPSPDGLWARAAELDVNLLGTSPAYIAACAKANVRPDGHDLTNLRTLGVTGSTLPAPAYHWIAENVGRDVQIASMSGGTDVVTGFCGGAPTVPVWPGEISAAFLGVALDAYDEAGNSVRNQVGELVVTRPMPSMPVSFWNDPDGRKLHDAYFGTFPGVWRHGDWITITDRGTILMHGRSDATLNRHGIRMGSADIYEAVEQLPEIREALVIGIDEPDGGYWMPLFVTLADGVELDDALRDRIRAVIRAHASPRHVPDEVLVAPGIPHTRTGKKLEVPIKRMLTGTVTGPAFDADSVDEPAWVDWYVALGRSRRAG